MDQISIDNNIEKINIISKIDSIEKSKKLINSITLTKSIKTN